ncbi:hypothetical protein PU629_06470 [Pullulanibacillus sp. KACC 23026]|uniref:DUF6711 family protein n=1 Tax=Pullulanibacillus sp. KACC 23026 TaxID=3028315 RepID=UPI0023B1070A|nr:DUF6711 family protein [Pullulanibacillus sp. KACC 23026]WEG14009.1 hypothetical protein PU629_06470 [Pullulanibacillus sp. KACC 23026]
MALITVGGVELTTPSDLQPGIQDISKAERNARGTMIIERIATKKTLDLSYSYLNASDLSAVLTAVSPVFFNVTYLDPVTNSFVTSSFYCGDRTMGMISYVNGVPRYKDVKFTLIER